tara:strand:- start:1048 stop:1533 length:486 start_codon:yes stop_codon:yes gene_type:complete
MKHLQLFEQFVNEGTWGRMQSPEGKDPLFITDHSSSSRVPTLRLKERKELTKKLIKATGINTWEVGYSAGVFNCHTRTDDKTGTEFFGVKDLDFSFDWRYLDFDTYKMPEKGYRFIFAKPSSGGFKHFYETRGKVDTMNDAVKAIANAVVRKMGWKDVTSN